MGPVEVEESHRSGSVDRPVGAAVGNGDEVVAEEVRAAEAAIPLPALGVEDPELRPPPRRPEAAPGDDHLGPLADDVATEPDPGSSGRARGGARSIRRPRSRGRRSARAARGRRGASPPAGRGPPGGAAGRRPSPGSCRRSGAAGRSMTRTSTERAARSIPAIDRPSSSVSGVRTTSQSSRTPRATASTGSRARARSSQATIAPSAWASATSRRARVVAPELGAPRSATPAFRGSPPGPTIASSVREAGPDDPLDAGSRLARGEQRDGEPIDGQLSGGSAGNGAVASAPIDLAELQPPTASGETPEPPRRPGRGWPSDVRD